MFSIRLFEKEIWFLRSFGRKYFYYAFRNAQRVDSLRIRVSSLSENRSSWPFLLLNFPSLCDDLTLPRSTIVTSFALTLHLAFLSANPTEISTFQFHFFLSSSIENLTDWTFFRSVLLPENVRANWSFILVNWLQLNIMSLTKKCWMSKNFEYKSFQFSLEMNF